MESLHVSHRSFSSAAFIASKKNDPSTYQRLRSVPGSGFHFKTHVKTKFSFGGSQQPIGQRLTEPNKLLQSLWLFIIMKVNP